jgi:predicted AAA+ superfamily ATPase
MVVTIKFGRRVPKAWGERVLQKAKNVLAVQEHFWTVIKADAEPEHQITITMVRADEDDAGSESHKYEWLTIDISSPVHAKEVEEYNETMGFFDNFAALQGVVGQKFDAISEMKLPFTDSKTFNKAKEAGARIVGKSSLAKALLENFGIIMTVERSWKD